MRSLHRSEEAGARRGKSPEGEAAAARWENEGGAPIDAVGIAAPLVVEHPAGWDSPSPRQAVALDVRQDDLMGAQSPEGHPPTHRFRRLEWWWLAIGASVLLVAGAVWVAIRGTDWLTVLGASGLIIALAGAAAPVWGAILLRNREERSARREARRELQDRQARYGTDSPGSA